MCYAMSLVVDQCSYKQAHASGFGPNNADGFNNEHQGFISGALIHHTMCSTCSKVQ